ncbi:MAG: NAD-dependent epimerase/dehydratase family protein [Chitinophagales bacterium]|nr:NAD-dependent epimerase/dehydratase family protein [Chitinophagales bacterium]
MIVITGASGFIASALIAYLNEKNIRDIVLVDNFSIPERHKNIAWKYYLQIVEREDFFTFLEHNYTDIQCIVHLGTKSGYIHNDWKKNSEEILDTHKKLWKFCALKNIKLIYASSGAVYGDGALGFKDDNLTTFDLNPSHPYARVKLEIDQWSLHEKDSPPFWYGLRMSNVYGPNEYHKGANASIVLKAYFEILEKQSMTLFTSFLPDIADGDMSRDFIYVKDVIKIIAFFIDKHPDSGIYNLGTGWNVSYNDVVNAVFEILEIKPQILYHAISSDLKNNFPAHVALDIQKLRDAGYEESMFSIQDGVKDYVKKYLKRGEFY